MLGMFLAAMEATAVAAAVPTAVGEMGGVARYSWVFSAYLLTSTTTVPLFGKLADLYGRRRPTTPPSASSCSARPSRERPARSINSSSSAPSRGWAPAA